MAEDAGRPLRIAVTGGIGSGKSYVCHILSERGIRVYDCDAAAKRLMRSSEDIRRQLCLLIGEEAYVGERVNKAAVARFLMESEENTQKVNAIVHPAVGLDFLMSGLTWMECAILFESGFDRYVDRVVCVTAPEEVRVARIMRRDDISREEAYAWMAKQMPQQEVLARSDYEIVNDGMRDVASQIDRLIHRLRIEDLRLVQPYIKDTTL